MKKGDFLNTGVINKYLKMQHLQAISIKCQIFFLFGVIFLFFWLEARMYS